MLMFLLSYRHVWCCAWPQTATETMPQSHNPPKHNPSHSQTKESHPEAVGAHRRGWKSCTNAWFSPNWGKMFAPLLAWAVGSCEPCSSCPEQAPGPDLHPALCPQQRAKSWVPQVFLNTARFPSGKWNTLLGKGRDLCLSGFLVSLLLNSCLTPLEGKKVRTAPPSIGMSPGASHWGQHGSHLVADEEWGVGDSRNVVTGAVQARERCAGREQLEHRGCRWGRANMEMHQQRSLDTVIPWIMQLARRELPRHSTRRESSQDTPGWGDPLLPHKQIHPGISRQRARSGQQLMASKAISNSRSSTTPSLQPVQNTRLNDRLILH